MNGSRLPRRLLLTGAGSAAVAALTACQTARTSLPTPQPTRAATSGTPDQAALRRKIASLLVVGFRGDRVKSSDWIVRAIRDGLGGVILFDRDLETGAARNVRSPQQVTTLVRELKKAAPGRLIVSIDQEGGRTARLNPSNGFPATRSEAEIGAENSPAATREWARGLVESLTRVGVNLNYAPVVDLNIDPASRAIGALDRSFSADPDVVVSNATEEIHAHRAAGVKTSLKHFPGIGSAAGNTDFEVVDVSATWRPIELEPYRRLIRAGLADSVLAAHVLNKQLDPNRPASLSPKVITDLLRGELGWQGPVVSDDMQAVAITRQYGSAEAVHLALQAGVDLLVFANQQVYEPDIFEKTLNAVVGLVESGKLSQARIDQSVARVDTLRPKR
ncbi:glycoside hydrolase family 3 N-terminal domain-containing protein [Micromonospora arborensis]|uniref:glycoside hydrolase family 3 N-terminal domain-containing protein n=1 Tax=Micromonospora arborensis TaxID=2116518 RepID=UPI00343891E5